MLVGDVLGLNLDELADRLNIDATEFAGMRCNYVDATPEIAERLSKLAGEAFFTPCRWSVASVDPVQPGSNPAEIIGFFMEFDAAGLPVFTHATLEHARREQILLAWAFLPHIASIPPELKAAIAAVMKTRGLVAPQGDP